MTSLQGRVALVTGAGRGLGREHALLLAREGARVVVNDRGTAIDGSGADDGCAHAVVAEIRAAGGEAVASTDDVADWDGGGRAVALAVEAFGDLHVVVNNAGILRDRYLADMTEQEWDDVVRVHLKGHFVPTRWAAALWRERAKAGRPVSASVVNTSSTSGLHPSPGQANYGAAKAGIAAFTQVAAAELGRYGVRANAVVPMARTRLTEATPGLAQVVRAPDDPSRFDAWHPGNVSPLVAVLASSRCRATGQVFLAHGGTVRLYQPWTPGPALERDGRWPAADLAEELDRLVPDG